MKANEILLTATDTISERGLTYGHPADNLRRTAMLLSAYLEIPIHEHQVGGIMVLTKLARSVETPSHLDDWIDMAGYAAIAGELATEENELYV